MKLAILIPSLTSVATLLHRAFVELDRQRQGYDVGIIVNEDQGQKSTGLKRNELIEEAMGQDAEYIAFFDADDLPGPNYVSKIMQGISGGYDCCSLYGQLYVNNKIDNPFHHSIAYKSWYQDRKMYYRCPNHLNAIKLSKVAGIKFQDKTIGEDGNWSMDIQRAGVLKTEYPINETIYHYFTGKRNHSLEPQIMINRMFI